MIFRSPYPEVTIPEMPLTSLVLRRAQELADKPAIVEAAVIPSPDEAAGEVPKAFVVLNDEITPEEIMAYAAGRVAPHKKICRVEIIEEIPKSLTGKLLRRVLIERERQTMEPMVEDGWPQ